MARLPRVVAVGVPHHITQRGNARQIIFHNDADRSTYLDLLSFYADLCRLTISGYCLMSNHIHLIAIPQDIQSLAKALKNTHSRYAAYWNARRSSSGHVWQGRFYSCPVDESHLWKALRYVELNPVRAAMVHAPEQWKWSSAGTHCGLAAPERFLEMHTWRKRWNPEEWSRYLSAPDSPQELLSLRKSTYTGRPLGQPEFVSALEVSLLRPLAPRKGGRPKRVPDTRQSELTFFA